MHDLRLLNLRLLRRSLLAKGGAVEAWLRGRCYSLQTRHALRSVTRITPRLLPWLGHAGLCHGSARLERLPQLLLHRILLLLRLSHRLLLLLLLPGLRLLRLLLLL